MANQTTTVSANLYIMQPDYLHNIQPLKVGDIDFVRHLLAAI